MASRNILRARNHLIAVQRQNKFLQDKNDELEFELKELKKRLRVEVTHSH